VKVPARSRAIMGLLFLAVASCGSPTVVEPKTSGRQVSCGGDVPFSTDVLSAPPLEEDGHPAVPAVRQSLRDGDLSLQLQFLRLPPSVEIRLLSETDGRATFALGDTTKDFPSVTFALEGEKWDLKQSSSNCQLRGWANGRPASPWSLDGPLDRASRRVSALVTEQDCASGSSAEGRIDEPKIEWSEDTAIITITVRSRTGPGELQTCPSNPPTPFTFDLPAPLGERTLLDGFHVPPAPPGTPRPPV
jgi:hypothetical protein